MNGECRRPKMRDVNNMVINVKSTIHGYVKTIENIGNGNKTIIPCLWLIKTIDVYVGYVM